MVIFFFYYPIHPSYLFSDNLPFTIILHHGVFIFLYKYVLKRKCQDKTRTIGYEKKNVVYIEMKIQ